MELLDLAFTLGLILAIVGVVKRKERLGKHLLWCGLLLMAGAFAILSYPDFKAGFMDALRD